MPPRLIQLLYGRRCEVAKLNVLCQVASDPATSTYEFVRLARSKRWSVRHSVAGNPSAPPKVLRHLGRSEDWKIRRAVAHNLNTPDDLLVQLAHDEDASVRHAVASNPHATVEALAFLASTSLDEMRSLVPIPDSHFPYSIPGLVEQMHTYIRQAIASNPRTPPDILAQLANDNHLAVS